MPDESSLNLGNDRLLPSALAFFDMFRMPLTAMEAWRWRYCRSGSPVSVVNVRECLGDRCGTESGTYRLTDGKADIRLRQRRYRLAESKFRRAGRFASFARLLPTVRLVAVGNSLSWSNSDQDGDIDVFVVAAPGTVWLTRFVLGGALIVLGLRPTPKDRQDRICLSFLVSQSHLDLSGLQIRGDDVYLAYWLAGLVPIYDCGGVAESLWMANWRILSVLPNAGGPRCLARRRRVGRPFGYRFGQALVPAFRFLEPVACRLQEWRFPKSIREMANRDSRVVIRSDVLKFHVNDRRQEFSRNFFGRLFSL
ncbi:hypothetical protein JW899_00125 [Candidatus Uhrbacteria bacterium]|nr:hypothetical protein [Candidatus Uhrbacteria bacterium]